MKLLRFGVLILFLSGCAKKSENIEKQVHTAMTLFQSGQSNKALSLLQSARKHCKNKKIHAEITNNYACVLAQQKQYDQAYSLWEDLLSNEYYMTPEVALCNQSKICVAQGKIQKAQKLLEQALDFAPDYLDAQYYVSLVSFCLHDVKKAQRSIEIVLASEPSHYGARQLLKTLASHNSIVLS